LLKGIPRGLKPLVYAAFCGTALELAEKAFSWGTQAKKHLSAAEAADYFQTLSGTTEVVPFQNSKLMRPFQQALKPCPFKAYL
jgi:hypothetical protein